jgi:helix-turn-helix protein
MDLFIRDCAFLLDLPENVVRRWVRRREIPSYRLQDKYRIGRVDLLEWAMHTGHPVSARLFTDEPPDAVQQALARGGVHRIPGSLWPEVARSIAGLPVVPEVARPDLEALLQPELGRFFEITRDGFALPKPRRPIVTTVESCTLSACLLEPPLPSVLFLLQSPSVRHHLGLLTLLWSQARDDGLRDRLTFEALPPPIDERVTLHPS